MDGHQLRGARIHRDMMLKSHRCIGSLEPAVALRAVAGAAIATSMAASGTAPGVDPGLFAPFHRPSLFPCKTCYSERVRMYPI